MIDYKDIISEVVNLPEVTTKKEYEAALREKLSEIGVQFDNTIVQVEIREQNPF